MPRMRCFDLQRRLSDGNITLQTTNQRGSLRSQTIHPVLRARIDSLCDRIHVPIRTSQICDLKNRDVVEDADIDQQETAAFWTMR
jgi:hypothetical protein